MTRLRWGIAIAAAATLVLVALAWRFGGGSATPGWTDCTAAEVLPRPAWSAGEPVSGVELVPILEVAFPTSLSTSPSDGWMFITERAGRVLTVPPDRSGPATVALDLSDAVSDGFEQGLLGSAVSPDGAWLYLNRTDPDGHTRVDAYPISAPGVVDGGSGREILTVEQPHRMHNGGSMDVDADGRLYIAVGDGGGLEPPDPDDVGQDPATMRGSVLRIAPTPQGGQPYRIPEGNPFVDDPDARDEVWLMGLRNPWMISVDGVGRRLWVPDVGHFCYEEINVVPLDRGGSNLGWKRVEGVHAFEGELPDLDDLHWPIHVYDRELGEDASGELVPVRCAIIGGRVYRGSAIAELDGGYLFGDFCDGQVRALWETSAGPVIRDVGAAVDGMTGFGTGPDGEIHLLTPDAVLQLTPSG